MLAAQQSQRSAKTPSKASQLQGRSPTCKTRGRYKSCLLICKNQSTQHDREGGEGWHVKNHIMLQLDVGCHVNLSQYVTTGCVSSQTYINQYDPTGCGCSEEC